MVHPRDNNRKYTGLVRFSQFIKTLSGLRDRTWQALANACNSGGGEPFSSTNSMEHYIFIQVDTAIKSAADSRQRAVVCNQFHQPLKSTMKPRFVFFTMLFTLVCTYSAQSQKTDIMIMGSDHFAQIYNRDNPHTDVLLPQRQKEIKGFLVSVIRYHPDLIMVEVLPENQQKIDSIYTLYVANKLKLEDLADGRSEVYQLAFRMAKQLGLPKIYCVNAPGGTSQSILDNGDNINLYKEEGLAVRAMVMEEMKAFQENRLSLKDYLYFLNLPATYNRVYRLRYMTPSRVTNGTFKNPDTMVDTAFVNPQYIGAELTSVYKNRDYKIYSNIVTSQMKTKAKRTLLIIGAAHIGSLKSIFRDDDEYNLVDTKTFLQR